MNHHSLTVVIELSRATITGGDTVVKAVVANHLTPSLPGGTVAEFHVRDI